MVMARKLTWGGEHTVQYTDNVLQTCTPETYAILLTNDRNKFNKNNFVLYLKLFITS